MDTDETQLKIQRQSLINQKKSFDRWKIFLIILAVAILIIVVYSTTVLVKDRKIREINAESIEFVQCVQACPLEIYPPSFSPDSQELVLSQECFHSCDSSYKKPTEEQSEKYKEKLLTNQIQDCLKFTQINQSQNQGLFSACISEKISDFQELQSLVLLSPPENEYLQYNIKMQNPTCGKNKTTVPVQFISGEPLDFIALTFKPKQGNPVALKNLAPPQPNQIKIYEINHETHKINFEVEQIYLTIIKGDMKIDKDIFACPKASIFLTPVNQSDTHNN
jgi:hypothetical protein